MGDPYIFAATVITKAFPSVFWLGMLGIFVVLVLLVAAHIYCLIAYPANMSWPSLDPAVPQTDDDPWNPAK